MKIHVEESKRSKQGIRPCLRIVEWRSGICFVNQTLHIEEKPMIMIIKFQWILLLKKVGFNYIFYKFVELYCWFTCHVLNKTYLRNTKKRDGPKYEKWMVIEISLVKFTIWWWSRNFGISKIAERTWIWVGANQLE